MKNRIARFALAAAGLAIATPVLAASDYVMCDGQAKGMGVAEGIGRLAVIIGSMGLLGSPESDNAAERRFGAEGVAACTRAMDDGKGKSDDRRRSRLLLARAIHHIEANDLDAALADVRSFPAAGGALASEPNFGRSLALSALDLEATILMRKGDLAGAEAAALKMAAATPYDALTQLRASRYIARSLPTTPARTAYYERLGLVFPDARLISAATMRWQGDYAGAAQQQQILLALVEPNANLQTIRALAGLDLLMAGQGAAAQSLLDAAREINEREAAGTPDVNGRDSITRTDEILAFSGVVKMMQAGDVAGARKAFAARERWMAVPVPTTAAVATRLRAGVTPADLTGALARDPDTMKADTLKREVEGVTKAEPKTLYAAIRPFLTDGNYNGLARNVNEIAKSKYLPVKQDTLRGERVVIVSGSGVAANEAVYLHSALIARSRGLKTFAILPGNVAFWSARVLFDKPGGALTPREAFFDVDTVIADLGPRFTPPPTR